MKNNKTIFIIIGVLIVALLLGGKLGLFAVTGNERITRGYTSINDPGAIVTVTYTASSISGQWGASIVDNLHCNTPIVLNGGWSGDVLKQFVIISDEGSSKTIQYTLPNVEGVTCTFSGNYQFGNKSIITFTDQTIQTRVTTIPHNSKSCYDNDVYWYNSKNVLEDKFAECGTAGCLNGACKVCAGTFDSDCNGIISRTELGVAISGWISGSITRTDLGGAIQSWAAN